VEKVSDTEIGEINEESLQQELAGLLNKFSQENDSGTPDFVLAEFLLNCLAAWNTGIVQRQAFLGEPVVMAAGLPDEAQKSSLSLPLDPPHGVPAE
jgi:hypothetical protein